MQFCVLPEHDPTKRHKTDFYSYLDRRFHLDNILIVGMWKRQVFSAWDQAEHKSTVD